jgi:hypothetical protein
VTFFAGVVALELAFVSGLCAASRVLSLWRRAEAPVADRRYVQFHSAWAISYAGFAGAFWGVTVLNGPIHARGWHHASLVGGLVLLLGSAVLLSAPFFRLRLNVQDEATADGDIPVGALGIGERVIALVRRHPAAMCAVVAVVAAAGAMSHAETTVVGALPWGIAQVAAVVLGFVVLGPRLGLRERSRAAEGTAI